MTLILAAYRRSVPVGAFLGKLLGLRNLLILREPGNCPEIDLKKYPEFSVVRAHWSDGKLKNLSDEVRASTKYFLFQDVLLSVSRRGGFIRTDEALIVPDNAIAGPPKLFFPGPEVASILAQSGENVLVRDLGADKRLEKGVFGGSMAPHNWFHWLIDILPNLYQANYLPESYSSFPLLVPAEVKARHNWMTALELVAGSREVVFLRSDCWVQVDQLVKLQGVTRPNPRPSVSGIVSRVGILSKPLLDYRDHILRSLELSKSRVVKGQRLFVGRRSSRARNYNQDEVFDVAASRGFQIVFLEDLSFSDSVRVFREAEVIVGPHDAGWANLLFSSAGTKAFMWTWEGGEEDNWYENVAFVTKVRYKQLRISTLGTPTQDNRDANYILDPVVFERELDEILER